LFLKIFFWELFVDGCFAGRSLVCIGRLENFLQFLFRKFLKHSYVFYWSYERRHLRCVAKSLSCSEKFENHWIRQRHATRGASWKIFWRGWGCWIMTFLIIFRIMTCFWINFYTYFYWFFKTLGGIFDQKTLPRDTSLMLNYWKLATCFSKN